MSCQDGTKTITSPTKNEFLIKGKTFIPLKTIELLDHHNAMAYSNSKQQEEANERSK